MKIKEERSLLCKYDLTIDNKISILYDSFAKKFSVLLSKNKFIS